MNARVRAPEFPDGLEWVNLEEPLKLARLRERVVLLHFWCWSNVHAEHMIPDLRYLENKYHDGVTVIGVHVPKYAHERDPENLLKAVNRRHVKHPVVSDPNYWLWQLYDVKAWPTVAVVDTEGELAGVFVGEGRRNELDEMVGELLEQAAEKDTRVFESLQFPGKPEVRSVLRFPSKLIAGADVLYVSDSGNNRVLEVNFEGRILRQFGSGNHGFWDGKSGDAGFSDPKGLALIRDHLYVADRGNHAIRRVKLLTGDVETVAGNGTHGLAMSGETNDPRSVALNSPRDLAAVGDRLFIAMGGQNQVWSLDLNTSKLAVFAGSGRYGMDDGDAKGATFAQPAGLTVHSGVLYVADADNSAIRSISIAGGQVQTLAGAGQWEFGEKDGLQAVARLQHPIAVCADTQAPIVWIADSFNNKLRALSLRGSGVRTLMVKYKFAEPCGIAATPGSLWIANTNMHEVVRLDSATGSVKHIPIGE